MLAGETQNEATGNNKQGIHPVLCVLDSKGNVIPLSDDEDSTPEQATTAKVHSTPSAHCPPGLVTTRVTERIINSSGEGSGCWDVGNSHAKVCHDVFAEDASFDEEHDVEEEHNHDLQFAQCFGIEASGDLHAGSTYNILTTCFMTL